MIGLLVLAGSLQVATPPAPDPRRDGRRPEPPITEEQRAEDALNRPSEGSRSGDFARPDRLICDLRRVPGSNLRQRICSTVQDRERARGSAREVAPGGAGGTHTGR
jgi:hypothetical protein